jgi:hypothetical protein
MTDQMADKGLKVKEKDDRKKITLFVDAETHRASAIKLAELGGVPAGYSFQTVLQQLLAEWAGGKREVEAQPEKPLGPERYRQDLERLLDVLEHASPSDRDIVRGVVQRYAKDLQKHPEPVKAMPPNPSRSSKSARDGPRIQR